MTARYALAGDISGDLLSYGGRVLVHNDPHELGFLITGARVVTLPRDIPDDQTLPISAHPEMAGVRFPLVKGDFR